jgi:hypothetical protein
VTLIQAVQIIAILSALIGGGRWLLGFYFKKANELEALKLKNQTEKEAALTSEINRLKASSEHTREQMVSFDLKLTKELTTFQVTLATHAGKLSENGRMMEMLQKQWEVTSTNLQEKYAALEGAEVVKVGKDTYIFKGRKP